MIFWFKMNVIQAERADIIEIDTTSKHLFIPNQASKCISYEKTSSTFSEYS